MKLKLIAAGLAGLALLAGCAVSPADPQFLVATEEFMAQYQSFEEYTDPGEDRDVLVAIVVKAAVKDFKFIEVGENDDGTFKQVAVLHAVAKLSSDKPFLFNWNGYGGRHDRGISYVDAAKKTRYFVLMLDSSSKDDPLYMIEFGHAPR